MGDFRDRNTGTDDYDYWPNGDLKKDGNKDITQIDYNFLRLPNELTLTNSRWVKYHYGADGQKLRKQNSTGETWDYAGEFIYKNGSLYQIAHEEGRIANGKYEYNYTDHLGNLRLSFRDSLTVGAPPVITQQNHYSPFGLSLQGVDFQSVTSDLYKYSQNEQQNDFGARFSDPTIGNRFWQQDPLAEISRRFSPYIYANANPMRFIDPDGLSAQDVDTYTLSDGTTVSYDVNTQKTLGYDTSTQREGDNPPGKKQENGKAEAPASQLLPQTFGDKWEKQQDRQLVKNGELDVDTYNLKAHSIVDPLAEAAYSSVFFELAFAKLAGWIKGLYMAETAAKGGKTVLEGAVKSNYSRFVSKIPANSKASASFELLEDGNYLFKATSPGKVPGSSALYQKWVNPQGETFKMLKTTFAPDGSIIHIKPKM